MPQVRAAKAARHALRVHRRRLRDEPKTRCCHARPSVSCTSHALMQHADASRVAAGGAMLPIFYAQRRERSLRACEF